MHSILTVAGLLALVGLAFGEHAVARVAQAIIIGTAALVLLVTIDILTHGMISDHL